MAKMPRWLSTVPALKNSLSGWGRGGGGGGSDTFFSTKNCLWQNCYNALGVLSSSPYVTLSSELTSKNQTETNKNKQKTAKIIGGQLPPPPRDLPALRLPARTTQWHFSRNGVGRGYLVAVTGSTWQWRGLLVWSLLYVALTGKVACYTYTL